MHLNADELRCPAASPTSYEIRHKKWCVTVKLATGYTNSEAARGIEYPFVDHRNVCRRASSMATGKGNMIFLAPITASYHNLLGTPAMKKVSADGSPGPRADDDANRTFPP